MTDTNNTRIILLLCLISSLGRFVIDNYLPSLPAIGSYFNISTSATQFTLTIYLLGFGISQLIFGPLSDRYGRRIIILSGLTIFFIGSLLCIAANSLGLLLISRLIAGIGAGSCGALNRAIAGDCFKGAEFSRAWSYTTTTLVLTLMVAPVIGGYIQDIFDWRANFILASFFVITVLAIILKFLPETNQHILKSSLQTRNVLRNYYIILINPAFLMCTLCYTLAFSGLIIYFQVSPLLLIDVFGLSPTQYGWCSLIIASSYLIGGLIVNKLSRYISIRNLLFLGTSLLIAGGTSMLLAYYLQYINLAAVLVPSAIYVTGARIIIPNAMAGSMESFRHLGGSSSALIGCIQMTGSSLISLLVARCNDITPFALAIFFIILGCLSLTTTCFIRPINKAV